MRKLLAPLLWMLLGSAVTVAALGVLHSISIGRQPAATQEDLHANRAHFTVSLPEAYLNQMLLASPGVVDGFREHGIHHPEILLRSRQLVAAGHFRVGALLWIPLSAEASLHAQDGRLAHRVERVRIAGVTTPGPLQRVVEEQLGRAIGDINQNLPGPVVSVEITPEALQVQGYLTP
jgi:hypothetical protein